MGQHSTVYDGETEATRTALRLLNLHQDKFEKVFIFLDSKAALLSAGSTETVISAEATDCQAIIRQLKAKHKQTALQWVPRHCQIAGSEHADALAKKGCQNYTRVVPKVMSNNFCKVTCFIIDKPNKPP